MINAGAVCVIIFMALVGCQKSRKAEAEERDRLSQPAETTASDEVPGHGWNIKAIGLPTTKFLLPYVGDSSADGGSHRYICEVSSNGDIVRAILFISPREDHEAPQEVYVVTYPNNIEKRQRLSATEAETEIRQIEAVLAESGAKDQYDYFYAGGEMIYDQSSDDDGDLFNDEIPEEVDLDSEDVQRKMAEAVNQATLFHIANWVEDYRRTIRRGEQGGAGQPASQSRQAKD